MKNLVMTCNKKYYEFFDNFCKDRELSVGRDLIVGILLLKFLLDRRHVQSIKFYHNLNEFIKLPTSEHMFVTALRHVKDFADNRLGKDILSEEMIGGFSSTKFGTSVERKKTLDSAQSLLDDPCFDFTQNDEQVRIRIKYLFSSLSQYLVEKSANYLDSGFVQPNLVRFIAKALNLTNNDIIYEPVTGYEMFAFSPVLHSTDCPPCSVVGQNLNASVYKINKIESCMLGADATIINNDWLISPVINEATRSIERYSFAVCTQLSSLKNTNFDAIRDDDYGRFSLGLPGKSSPEFALILHLIHSVDLDVGRFAVLVPYGFLYKDGEERKIRRNLVVDNWIDTIVTLPSRVTYGLSSPVVLVIFKANKQDDAILFIDGAQDFDGSRNINLLTENWYKKILGLYESRQTVYGASSLVGRQVIEDNNFNLNVNKYLLKETAEVGEQDLNSFFDKRKELLRQFCAINPDSTSLLEKLGSTKDWSSSLY